VPVDHPTIDHRERLWDRARKIATDPFRILYQKKLCDLWQLSSFGIWLDPTFAPIEHLF
jgi:hypothetical protein